VPQSAPAPGEGRLLLERRHGRLQEHEDLGGGVERELLDARGERPQACDQGGAAGGHRGERVGEGTGMPRV
jgi:hypothetical protein